MPGELLTIDEAAARLSCSRRTVYRLIAEGRLQSVKVRGLRRVGADAIRRYLARDTERKAS